MIEETQTFASFCPSNKIAMQDRKPFKKTLLPFEPGEEMMTAKRLE
jgi:hypothetical protein